MDGSRSRSFALTFTAVIVLGTVALVLFAERSLRSREDWTLTINAKPETGGRWSLEARPSRSIHLYALAKAEGDDFRLLFPGPRDHGEVSAGAIFIADLLASPGAELLVLADPQPLWKLEEIRARGDDAPREGVLVRSEVLAAVRGFPADGAVAVVPCPPHAPGVETETAVRGLYARRFAPAS